MRLAVTREANKVAGLAAKAKADGIELVPLPFLLVRKKSFTVPAGLDMAKVDWILFSSANGVRSFFSGLKQLGMSTPESCRMAAVGGRTAAALSEAGFDAAFVPSVAEGKHLFEEFIERYGSEPTTVVYARGVEVNFDPASLCDRSAVAYYPIICYETLSQPVDRKAVQNLNEGDYILFTATSTVDAYQSQFGAPRAKAIAIGRTTAARMESYGWTVHRIMRKADIDTVLENL